MIPLRKPYSVIQIKNKVDLTKLFEKKSNKNN